MQAINNPTASGISCLNIWFAQNFTGTGQLQEVRELWIHRAMCVLWWGVCSNILLGSSPSHEPRKDFPPRAHRLLCVHADALSCVQFFGAPQKVTLITLLKISSSYLQLYFQGTCQGSCNFQPKKCWQGLLRIGRVSLHPADPPYHFPSLSTRVPKHYKFLSSLLSNNRARSHKFAFWNNISLFCPWLLQAWCWQLLEKRRDQEAKTGSSTASCGS